MNATSKSVLSVLAFAALAAAAPAHGETYTVYTTNVQNFTTLPYSLPDENQWYTLYCLDVGTLNTGDILVVMGESQTQQPSATDSIFAGARLVRYDSCPTAETDFSYTTGGTALDAANGIGVSPTEYRAVAPKGATVTVTAATTGQHYVLYNVKALSDNNDDMDVPMNTGDLQILKIHP